MILITGATGFVGQSLSASLEQGEYTIRRSTNRMSSLDWAHELESVNTVVHLAARVHVMQDKSADPLAEFRAINVHGTLNLARQAATAGVKRFVFLSSVKVNGEFTLPGQPFTADEANPQDPYGVSKYEAELGLHVIAAETGMQVVIIRPPLIYGAGVKANFASLLRVVRRGMPLPLALATHNRRSFVSLNNLVDFIITCIHHPNATSQTFLVSDNDDVSTADLLRYMATAFSMSARLIPVPLSLLAISAKLLGKADVAQRLLGNLQVDITKNKTLLGWQPPFTLQQGLNLMANSPKLI